MDGSVIAALAVLETPNRMNTDSSQKKDISEFENGGNDSIEQIGVYSEGVLDETKQFLRNSRQQFLWGVLSYFGGHIIALALSYVLHNTDSSSFANYLQGVLLSSPGSLVFSAMSIGFSNACSSNGITAERGVARRHLYNQGGFWSNYPGLNFFAIYMILAISITALATRFVANESLNFPALILTKLLVGLLLTNLHTAWVHAIISKPNKKSLCQRIPGWREWIGIMPAASVDLALPKCVHYLMHKLLAILPQNFLPIVDNQIHQELHSVLSTFETFAIYMPAALEFLTSILTRAIYIRVAASMLPDDDESIIPFDPSFGGRARNNETLCLSILDAIKTMRLQNWHHYRRIVREVLQYEFPFVFLFIIAIALEFYFEEPCTFGDLLELFASMFLVE